MGLPPAGSAQLHKVCCAGDNTSLLGPPRQSYWLAWYLPTKWSSLAYSGNTGMYVQWPLDSAINRSYICSHALIKAWAVDPNLKGDSPCTCTTRHTSLGLKNAVAQTLQWWLSSFTRPSVVHRSIVSVGNTLVISKEPHH